MNHYELLEVDVTASTSEIHRAYVRLARLHHPDFFTDSAPSGRAAAEMRMRSLNEAWSILGDEARRRDYDESIGVRRPAPAAVARPFVPFDTEEDPDPLTLPDIPYRIEPKEVLVRRGFVRVLVPIGLAFATMLVMFALLGGSSTLLRASVVIFGLAGAGFVVLPLLALYSSKRDEG